MTPHTHWGCRCLWVLNPQPLTLNPKPYTLNPNPTHRNLLQVFMDIVHSHSCSNVLDGLNMFDGTDHLYLHV